MEGTRHERVVTVIASYVIGFTTAFILYSNVQVLTQEVFISVPEQNAAVALSQVETEPEVQETEDFVSLSYQNGRLVLQNGSEVKLLSYSPELNDLNVDIEALEQGFHFGELKYSFSQNKEFVFFCERHSAELESCDGYVYDVKEDKIYPITKEGNPVIVSAKSAQTAGWSDDALVIGDNRSANPSAPWVIIPSSSQLDLQ